MRHHYALCTILLTACATEYDPLADYEEVDPATILTAPIPAAEERSESELQAIETGGYLVELLGCGACHTDGALIGEPDPARALAGSRIGIAYSNPLEHRFPAIAYPKNLTPDDETGLGLWTSAQIAAAIGGGAGRHGHNQAPVMPSSGYRKLRREDLDAIVSYLQSLKPVSHRVPDSVTAGARSKAAYVYFGVYRSRVPASP